MKIYNCKEEPLRVYGIPHFYEKMRFERLPESIRGSIERLRHIGERCAGARVGFRTDAESFTVRVTLKTLTPDVGMSIYSCQAVNVMVGDRENSVFIGIATPPDYSTKTFEKTFTKKREMEEVTLWLPRNEVLENLEIEVPDEARVESPTPYKHGKALFYGSSITEGGCCTAVTNCYVSLLSRWLDLDFYNFGFSGSARGELEIADYINTVDMDIFVYDYDYNAPDVAHLKATHEPFFKRIREKHPTIPVIMLSRPNFRSSPDAKERREVIKATYENARAFGDENVYFIDGETFFGEEDNTLCTLDTVHPNDLGFYRMAKAILPTFEKILGAKKP